MKQDVIGKIRLVKKSDLIQCQDIIYACLNLVCSDYTQNAQLRKHYSLGNLERFCDNSKIFYVFEYKNKVVGAGRINAKNEIRTLYIDPLFQKRGVGKRILAKLEVFLQKDHQKRAYLHALGTAIRFYEKQGYYKVKNFQKRDNRMEKILS